MAVSVMFVLGVGNAVSFSLMRNIIPSKNLQKKVDIKQSHLKKTFHLH